MRATLKHETLRIPTYVPNPPHTLPFFIEKKAYQGASGQVYPIPYTDSLSNEPKDRMYDAYTLENEHIRVTLLPEVGGKIHGAIDKHNGYDFIYQNAVIKPAMVGLAGPWVSGGVEFNWPQHHRPTTFMPTEATAVENADGSVTVWMGEAEPFHRMRGMVGITVYPGRSYVEAKAIVYNRTDTPLPFMWWNNLAVRVHSDYKAVFPPDVAFANDHDRRAVIPFPVMKGVYQTARPFDYGEGTDATWFSNIKLPTSVMIARGQSQMDFIGGYDFAKCAGTITVSDHHTSVGKKMWTWGDGPFGNAWCGNLTDNGDRYIELMTGVYTDNQPDFTYIMPGETKTFSQVWYPIQGIGEVKNATLAGAVSLSLDSAGVAFGAYATSRQDGAAIRLSAGDKVLYEKQIDISPANSFTNRCDIPGNVTEKDLVLELLNASGRTLVRYQPPCVAGKQPPKARQIPPDPCDVESIEALYLHGAHLEQYKHHTYEPEAYYREALQRDAGDYRCNFAMGRIALERGDFSAARIYLQKAIDRLKMRNDNPADTEAIYHMARLERLEGNIDRAYDLFWDAAWQYAWRSPSYYEIACIDSLRGQRDKACAHLKLCLETNARHYAARALLAYFERDTGALDAILKEAPQDALTRFCLHLLTGRPLEGFLTSRSEDMTDIALDLKHAGLFAEAERALSACTAPSQMVLYHLAAIAGRAPAHMPLAYCFPNRLEDIQALQREEWQAQYLLGCLYYSRMFYRAAMAAWEKAAALSPTDAFTKRCLAQAYFDHGKQPEKALVCLREALSLAPDNARIFYELLQMEKNSGASVRDRLRLMEQYPLLPPMRDDCYLDQIILYTQNGQYEKARAMLLSKRFNIYEGGEGKLTRHHGWLYTLMGRQALLEGNPEQALEWLKTALVYPDNYGEGRHYSAQEGNIHYHMGLAYEAMGQREQALKAYQAAASQPGQMTEMLFFTALALKKLGQSSAADEVFSRMVKAGESLLATSHRWGYFGVGTPAPLPSELDIQRMNTIDSRLLLLLGHAGLGQSTQVDRSELKKLDPWNTKLDFFEKLELI